MALWVRKFVHTFFVQKKIFPSDSISSLMSGRIKHRQDLPERGHYVDDEREFSHEQRRGRQHKRPVQ